MLNDVTLFTFVHFSEFSNFSKNEYILLRLSELNWQLVFFQFKGPFPTFPMEETNMTEISGILISYVNYLDVSNV